MFGYVLLLSSTDFFLILSTFFLIIFIVKIGKTLKVQIKENQFNLLQEVWSETIHGIMSCFTEFLKFPL